MMDNKYVFALYEVHHIEGAHMHSLFTTRKAALKSGLELKRKRVQQAESSDHEDRHQRYGTDTCPLPAGVSKQEVL